MTILAVFGVASLGALLFVILATRACSNCNELLYGGMAVPADPYIGASTAARTLSFRDTARRRGLYGALPGLDGPTAQAMLDGSLLARGYLAGVESSVVTLSADVSVPELDRSCGVIAIEAQGTSHLIAGGRGSALRDTDDPSAMAFGACGDGPYRIEGVGTAVVRAYLMPGLVAGDVERTGLPEDVLLAHAEAEVLLASVAYEPTDELVRIEVTAGGGSIWTLPEPTSGCVPWAVVVVGAGRSRTTTALPVEDYAVDRALGLAITCAGSSGGGFDVTDAGGDGYLAWARPYSSRGAALPSASTHVTIGEASVVGASALTLPAPFPATPIP
jgi:hypothetical protein